MAIDIIGQDEFLIAHREQPAHNFYLHHELGFFDEHFKWMVERQEFHGEHLGAAMREGAETFHDNAPAEAIVADQEVLVNEVRKMRAVLKNAVIVEYPAPSQRWVSIGTLCLLDINNSDTELCYVVGEPNGYRDMDFGYHVTPVSVKAPIGKSIIGTTSGCIIETEIGSRATEIRIVDLEQQEWPVNPVRLPRS